MENAIAISINAIAFSIHTTLFSVNEGAFSVFEPLCIRFGLSFPYFRSSFSINAIAVLINEGLFFVFVIRISVLAIAIAGFEGMILIGQILTMCSKSCHALKSHGFFVSHTV